MKEEAKRVTNFEFKIQVLIEEDGKGVVRCPNFLVCGRVFLNQSIFSK